jgi:hypothetical protein
VGPRCVIGLDAGRGSMASSKRGSNWASRAHWKFACAEEMQQPSKKQGSVPSGMSKEEHREEQGQEMEDEQKTSQARFARPATSALPSLSALSLDKGHGPRSASFKVGGLHILRWRLAASRSTPVASSAAQVQTQHTSFPWSRPRR